jgi:hypothetical protein
MTSRDPSTANDGGTIPGGLRCDFCGQETTSVRRVAIDRSYERLRTPHREQYACPACSERKERVRLGLERS